MRRFEWIPASACTRSVWSSATPRADPWAMPVRLSVRESYLGAECRGATQQGDEADEALGGTLVGIQERHVRRRRLVRPWARRRAHRLAAYRRCSTDVEGAGGHLEMAKRTSVENWRARLTRWFHLDEPWVPLLEDGRTRPALIAIAVWVAGLFGGVYVEEVSGNAM